MALFAYENNLSCFLIFYMLPLVFFYFLALATKREKNIDHEIYPTKRKISLKENNILKSGSYTYIILSTYEINNDKSSFKDLY